jgi:hypothetical protein
MKSEEELPQIKYEDKIMPEKFQSLHIGFNNYYNLKRITAEVE